MQRDGNLHGNDERGRECDGDVQQDDVHADGDGSGDGDRHGDEFTLGDQLHDGNDDGMHGELRGGDGSDVDGDAGNGIDIWELGRAVVRREYLLVCDDAESKRDGDVQQGDVHVDGDAGGDRKRDGDEPVGVESCDQLHDGVEQWLHGELSERDGSDADGDGGEREHVQQLGRARLRRADVHVLDEFESGGDGDVHGERECVERDGSGDGDGKRGERAERDQLPEHVQRELQ